MDKRVSTRNRVLRPGTIQTGGGGVINCMVRNLSSTGAMLDVASPVGIPEHFTLVLRIEGHRTLCRTVWRKEKRIGVVFE